MYICSIYYIEANVNCYNFSLYKFDLQFLFIDFVRFNKIFQQLYTRIYTYAQF